MSKKTDWSKIIGGIKKAASALAAVGALAGAIYEFFGKGKK